MKNRTENKESCPVYSWCTINHFLEGPRELARWRGR